MGSAVSSNSAKSSVFPEVLQKIRDGEIKRVVIMCGAGISTSAGIPDFRSPSTGLYFKLRKYDLPYPEAIFEYSYFRQDPQPFYHLVKELFPSKLTATDTHRFFTLLHQKGILQRIYTQNIDALEHIAGVPEEKIIEAHGTFHRAYCTKCKKFYNLPWLKERVFDCGEGESNVPKCEECGGVVRPDIVFFGESLPNRVWRNVDSDFESADLLLVFGTSLVVQPFCSFITKTGTSVPRIFINLTKPGKTGVLGTIMGMGKNIDFSRQTDHMILDYCDKAVVDIVKQLGWEKEWEEITTKELFL